MDQGERLSDEKLYAELIDRLTDLDAKIKEAKEMRLLGDIQNDIVKALENQKIKIVKENKDVINNVMQKLSQDMDKTSKEAEKNLQEIDRKIAEVDLQYAKMLVKEDIDTLKIAKIILEEKEKER